MKKENFNLDNLPKENIFKIPENYFHDLPMQIQAQTSGHSRVVPIISWSKRSTWGSVAACIAIAILGYFTLMPEQSSLGSESLADVRNQEIINYLIQQNLTQGDIAEQFNINKNIEIKDSELIENLKVSEKDILQSVDLEDIGEEI